MKNERNENERNGKMKEMENKRMGGRGSRPPNH
jgi:hypothetical protein